MKSKPMIRESHLWLLVLGLAVWFVVLLNPHLHDDYLFCLAVLLMAIPAAGVVALLLTIIDVLMVLWRIRIRRSACIDYGRTRWHVTHTVGSAMNSVTLHYAVCHPFATYRFLTEPDLDA